MTTAPASGPNHPLLWAALLAIAGLALAIAGVWAIAAGQLRLPAGPAIQYAVRPGAFYGAVSGIFTLAAVCGYRALHFLQVWNARH